VLKKCLKLFRVGAVLSLCGSEFHAAGSMCEKACLPNFVSSTRSILLNSDCSVIAGNILSIAVFNYCGITITKNMSATTRQVLDGGRVIVIWVVSLGVGWQPFNYR